MVTIHMCRKAKTSYTWQQLLHVFSLSLSWLPSEWSILLHDACRRYSHQQWLVFVPLLTWLLTSSRCVRLQAMWLSNNHFPFFVAQRHVFFIVTTVNALPRCLLLALLTSALASKCCPLIFTVVQPLHCISLLLLTSNYRQHHWFHYYNLSSSLPGVLFPLKYDVLL